MATSLYFGDLQPDTPYLDGSGRPLANAKLTFYRSGTTKPITVYSDEGLTTPITTDIVSDSEGVFPTVYLDPMSSYRVKLEDSLGRLVWDVDPYLFPANELAFLSPVYQAREDGAPVPGYELEFEDESTPYADGDLEVRLPNPIKANAGGFFPPIYLTVEDPPPDNPLPAITSLDPPFALVGSEATVVTIHGSNFIESSVARVDGSNRPTTYISSTQLQITLSVEDLDERGQLSVTVFNPSPGGGLSNAATFIVRRAAFFQSDPINSTDWDPVYGHSAIHHDGTTYVSWFFIGLGAFKGVHVAAYDHDTETWGARRTLGVFSLADDTHGVPSLVRDADGYLHCFFGSHNSVQRYSVSNSPDDVSTWTPRPSLSGNYTYPHPVLVGSEIYLFLRNRIVASPVRAVLVLRTATPVAGVASFSADATIIDFGANSRVYQSEVHRVGTELHFVCTKSGGADTERRGVYYFIYDTSDGSLSNFDKSVSVASGSLPVDLTTADASFRIYDHGANDGDLGSLQFDASGDAHVLFADGKSPTYSLKHMVLSDGSWSTPETIGTITDVSTTTGYTDTYFLAPGPLGTMQAWYNVDGDKVRRVWSSGTWGAEEIMARRDTRNFVHGMSVRDAHADFRVIFSESTLSVDDDDAEPIALYAHGDSGFIDAIDMTPQDPHFANVVLLLGFEGRDGSMGLIDESPMAQVPSSVSGNAQIDTGAPLIGAGSLLLDGIGDFVTYADDNVFEITSGDLCMEAFIEISATGFQTIFSKRNTGTPQHAFVLNTNSSTQLNFVAWANHTVVVHAVGSTVLSTGTRYHVAITREGTTWRLFLDGALEATVVESATPTGNTWAFCIGRDVSNPGNDFTGRIDEVRITRGAARYTEAFTAPTTAFPRQ